MSAIIFSIKFHGALLNIDVHNSYKSNLLKGKNEINIAPERIVSLRERDIKCYIDGHLVSIELPNKGRKIGKETYEGFPWEIKREKLKNFPVIFDFEECQVVEENKGALGFTNKIFEITRKFDREIQYSLGDLNDDV